MAEGKNFGYFLIFCFVDDSGCDVVSPDFQGEEVEGSVEWRAEDRWQRTDDRRDLAGVGYVF